MGFFDNLFNGSSDPRRSAQIRGGMLGAAQALLRPYSGIGDALTGAGYGAQQGKQDYMQDEFYDLRLQDMKAQQKRTEAQASAQNNLLLRNRSATPNAPVMPQGQEAGMPAAADEQQLRDFATAYPEQFGTMMAKHLFPDQPKYSGAPHEGINPATGKKEQYVINPADGQPKWLGVAAPDKAPTTVGGMAWDEGTNSFKPIPGYTAQARSIADAGRAPAADNPFGKGMTGHAYALLAAGAKDPAVRATPEYMTAWQILSNPRVDPNTGTIVVPDLSAYQPPDGVGRGQGGQSQQRMPSLQAFAPPNPGGPEALSAGYANRLASAAADIDKNEGALTSYVEHGKAGVPIIGNKLVSEEYQMGDQAERNFINAQLRRESGAAIAESEFANARKQYIPQPGDGPKVKAQKKAARDMAIRNMQLSAGNTLLPPGVIQNASPPRGAPIVPMEQGFGNQQTKTPPPDAIRQLKMMGPKGATQFDEVFGPGAAAKYLGKK